MKRKDHGKNCYKSIISYQMTGISFILVEFLHLDKICEENSTYT